MLICGIRTIDHRQRKHIRGKGMKVVWLNVIYVTCFLILTRFVGLPIAEAGIVLCALTLTNILCVCGDILEKLGGTKKESK